MKISRKLLAVAMIAVLAIVSFVPSTFSWYSHNGYADGKQLSYTDSYPISVKSAADTLEVSTFISDETGNAISVSDYAAKNSGANYPTVAGESVSQDKVVVSNINLPADASGKAVKYYKTVLKNTGTNDVMVDLETDNLSNNADFVIGTIVPTLNEKAFASRASRTKVNDNSVRVYFKPNSGMSTYWAEDDGTLDTNSNTLFKSTNTSTNDINIGFTVNGVTEYHMMTRDTDNDTETDGGTRKVYHYDVPSNASSFFFFNHWYMKLDENSNREWNCTIDITDLTSGRLYYLTGNKVDDKWKEYAVRSINGSTVDDTLVAVNSYYSNVRMSLGDSVFADIGLKKDNESDSDEFVPDYYGSQVTYSSGDATKVKVNKDGLLTPVASTTSSGVDTPVEITTTITGRYGDTRALKTKVSIPAVISQVTIIKNVRVPAGETVEVDWYALNKSHENAMTTDSIYYTL